MARMPYPSKTRRVQHILQFVAVDQGGIQGNRLADEFHSELDGVIGVAAAALLRRRLPSGIKNVGVILSGGNVDLEMLGEICSQG